MHPLSEQLYICDRCIIVSVSLAISITAVGLAISITAVSLAISISCCFYGTCLKVPVKDIKL
jgi:hypothetical protein